VPAGSSRALAKDPAADSHRADTRRTIDDANPQPFPAQPSIQAVGIAGHLDPLDTATISRVAGILDSRIAREEERQEGGGQGLEKAGKAGAEALALQGSHRRGESLGHRHDVVNGDRPAHQAIADLRDAPGQRTPELRARRLGGIGNPQYLQIAAAERNDPVVSAKALMASTSRGAEPVLGLDPSRSRVQIGRSEDDVIDSQRGADTTRAPRKHIRGI
jgi:hypothetical protein